MIFTGIFLVSFILHPVLIYGLDFKQIESEHFVISYSPSVEVNYVYKIKEEAEDFYRLINHEFSLPEERLWMGEKRTKIFIAEDKQAYLAKFKCPNWSGACVDYQRKIIYTFPQQERFSSLLLHELTHLIFREYVGENKLPLWVDEGIAVYMEYKYANPSYVKHILSHMRRVIKDGFYIKFKEIKNVSLDNKEKDYINLFYQQSFAMIYFLIERFGRDNFFWFLYYLRKGEGLSQALFNAYPLINSEEDFEKLWKRFYLN